MAKETPPRGFSVDRLRALAELTATRSRGVTAGKLGYWTMVAALFVVPVARSYEFLKSGRYLIAWMALYGVKLLWDWLRLGSFVEHSARPLILVNQGVAGAIDQLARTIIQSANRRLSETDCRATVVALLHRVRDYSQYAFEVEPSVQLRATLAVPICPPGSATPSSIRVWCYDSTHDDRRWTELPLAEGDGLLPGSPTAFRIGRVETIDDVWEYQHLVPDAGSRRFRSILSIPVKAGGPSGKVLAVLNIDAEKPKLFEESRVERLFIPMVAPIVNLIALALLARKEDMAYEFER